MVAKEFFCYKICAKFPKKIQFLVKKNGVSAFLTKMSFPQDAQKISLYNYTARAL